MSETEKKPKNKIIFVLLAGAFSVALFAGIVFAFLSFYSGAPRAAVVKFDDFRSDILPDVVPFEIAFRKTEPLQPLVKDPPPVNLGGNGAVVYTQFNETNGVNFLEYDKKAEAGDRLLYQVHFRFEDHVRVARKEPPRRPSETAVVFVGCSFTLGEGVEQEQTFSGLFAKKYPKLSFYNMGIGGGGLNDHLERLQLGDHGLSFLKGHKNIILVYTYMGDHLFRESCSTRCLQEQYDWVLQKPRYVIRDDGHVELKGRHAGLYLKNFATKLIFGSKFFADRDFPELEAPSRYRLHRALLNDFYLETAKHQAILDAYHFWGLANNPAEINALYNDVRATPFKPVILDFYGKNFRAGLSPYVIPVDTHPSPLGHQAMFEALEWRLQKDHPELFGRPDNQKLK